MRRCSFRRTDGCREQRPIQERQASKSQTRIEHRSSSLKLQEDISGDQSLARKRYAFGIAAFTEEIEGSKEDRS